MGNDYIGLGHWDGVPIVESLWLYKEGEGTTQAQTEVILCTTPELLAGSPSLEAGLMGPANLGLCPSRTMSQNQSPSPVKLACLGNFVAAMKS